MNDRMMRMGVGSVVLLALALGATAGESGPSERNRSSVEPSLDKPPVATVNAREHGVVGNGQADDTETLQAALNAAEKKGPVCYLPAGQYRINGALVVSGCEFLEVGKKEIVLEKGLKAATITGCLLRGEDAIVNESGADVQVGLNTTQ
jgi:hypothetical protein